MFKISTFLKACCLVLLYISCSHKTRSPSSISDKLLVIGDSQTAGFFGKVLYEDLSKQLGMRNIAVYGVGSSSPRHWAYDFNTSENRWLLDRWRSGRVNSNASTNMQSHLTPSTSGQFDSVFDYMNRKKLNFVMFQFLGNSMGLSQDEIKENVQLLLGQLDSTQQCIFITSPPLYRTLVEKNKLRLQTEDYFVTAIGKRCKIIRGMSYLQISNNRLYYNRDLVHLSESGARKFYSLIKDSLF